MSEIPVPASPGQRHRIRRIKSPVREGGVDVRHPGKDGASEALAAIQPFGSPPRSNSKSAAGVVIPPPLAARVPPTLLQFQPACGDKQGGGECACTVSGSEQFSPPSLRHGSSFRARKPRRLSSFARPPSLPSGLTSPEADRTLPPLGSNPRGTSPQRDARVVLWTGKGSDNSSAAAVASALAAAACREFLPTQRRSCVNANTNALVPLREPPHVKKKPAAAHGLGLSSPTLGSTRLPWVGGSAGDEGRGPARLSPEQEGGGDKGARDGAALCRQGVKGHGGRVSGCDDALQAEDEPAPYTNLGVMVDRVGDMPACPQPLSDEDVEKWVQLLRQTHADEGEIVRWQEEFQQQRAVLCNGGPKWDSVISGSRRQFEELQTCGRAGAAPLESGREGSGRRGVEVQQDGATRDAHAEELGVAEERGNRCSSVAGAGVDSGTDGVTGPGCVVHRHSDREVLCAGGHAGEGQAQSEVRSPCSFQHGPHVDSEGVGADKADADTWLASEAEVGPERGREARFPMCIGVVGGVGRERESEKEGVGKALGVGGETCDPLRAQGGLPTTWVSRLKSPPLMVMSHIRLPSPPLLVGDAGEADEGGRGWSWGETAGGRDTVARDLVHSTSAVGQGCGMVVGEQGMRGMREDGGGSGCAKGVGEKGDKEEEEDMLSLAYDPILMCWYERTSGRYFQFKEGVFEMPSSASDPHTPFGPLAAMEECTE